jgi:hypothetical protein
VTSISARQQFVIDLARTVWERQHEHDLDTVDGTFYWRGCRTDLVEPLLQAAAKDPADAGMRLGKLIPGLGSLSLHQGGPHVTPLRIPMRAAVTSVASVDFWLPAGEEIDGRSWKTKAVIQAKVRNAEWTGVDVAEAIHRAWVDYRSMYSEDYWPHHLEHLGAVPPEHLEMTMRVGPDRDGRLLDISERDTFRFEPEETCVSFDYKPSPDWVPDPFIDVTVSAPPPAKRVIASWFDDVAIDRYQWNLTLLGAKNGQDVATAIRTWSALLLFHAGMNSDDARWQVKDITSKLQDKSSYHASVDRIRDRVPELRLWLEEQSVRRNSD